VTVHPVPVTGSRLSPGEEALWLLHRLVPDRGITNVAIGVQPDGPLRWWPLREAFVWLVDRHTALRAAFPVRAGVPVSEIRPVGDVDAELDVVDVPPGGLDAALRDYAARPFDLDRPPLLRLGLFQVSAHEQYYCLAAHHLIVDLPSMRTLATELKLAYRALAEAGEPPRLPAPQPAAVPAPRPASLAYWRERLAGFDPDGTRLDVAGPPADPPSFAGQQLERTLPERVTGAVRALRSRSRSTDAAVLLAAYLLALRALGAADDAVVGLVVNTRGTAGADSIGYRAATLPLRVVVDPAESFEGLAGRVAAAMLGAVEHADTPFEVLATESTPRGDDPAWWRSRLIRHLFNFRIRPHSGEGRREVWSIGTGLTRFDLELAVEWFHGRYIAQLVYSTELYPVGFADALLDRMVAAIEQAGAVPDRQVSAFDLRTAEEIATQRAVNDTGRHWSGPGTVAGLVAAVWSARPAAVAVVDGTHTVHYGQLRDRAMAVAGLLREHGVRRADVVALCGPRGAGLAAAVLGTWAVGAAYLPLDPDHPEERLAHQLDDCGCRVVLDGHLLPDRCQENRICLPVPEPVGAPSGAPDLPPAVSPDDLAYVIYTSGSTGRPKGVRLTHGNLANVVRHFADQLDAGPDTTALWLTTFAFDISALELCLPLAVGGRVVVAPDPVRTDPERLLDLVERTGADLVQATPTTWRLVAPVAGGRLAGRTVLCGGEPLPPALARQLIATGCRGFNVYGPTETTVWSTVADLGGEDPDRPTVGRPLTNTRIHVLDRAGRPCPPGVVGELCIAGAGVADGYHGQPELTALRFPTDPELGRYYRTGDLAALRADGRVELRGRRDRQVKLRGHRIELTEVEGVLEDHPEVRAAAVVLRGDPSTDGYLAAYVVAADRPGLATDLWTFAGARLPGYSLPGVVHGLERLPQTPNGKVDVNALTAGALDAGRPGDAVRPLAGRPVDDGHEARLLDAWRQVLDRPALDRSANFFLSGGTSLLAVQLAEVVTEVCGVPVSLGMIFRAPTPAVLAKLIATTAGTG
jgi:amino acid adenylation domain-containing protein